MSVKLNSLELRQALKLLKPIYKNRSTLPILSCVLIEADSYEVRLTATNLEMRMTIMLRALGGSGEEKRWVVMGNDLELAFDDGSYVFLESESENLLVRQNVPEQRMVIPTLDDLDFPPEPHCWTKEPLVTLLAGEWTAFRERVFSHADNDDQRPVLASVHFQRAEDGALVAEAADGYRLVRHLLAFNVEPFTPFLLKVSSLKKLPRKVQRLYLPVMQELEDQQIPWQYLEFRVPFKTAHIDGFAFIRQEEGYFPDLNAIIPKNDELHTAVTVESRVIEQAAKIKYGTVLRLSEDAARLAIEPSFGHSQTKEWNGTAVRWKTDPDNLASFNHAAFNPKYLADMLPVANGSLTLKGSHPGNAFVASDWKTTYVIMPMRFESSDR